MAFSRGLLITEQADSSPCGLARIRLKAALASSAICRMRWVRWVRLAFRSAGACPLKRSAGEAADKSERSEDGSCALGGGNGDGDGALLVGMLAAVLVA